MRLLGKTPLTNGAAHDPPERISSREQQVHAALDKVKSQTSEAERLSRAWQEVRRAEQVLGDRRRSHQ